MHVFRIHIRPQGGSADMETTFNYCLKNRILGVGWRTDSNQNTTNWEEYYGEASKKYKKEPQSCKYINERVGEGDLVWTRDAGGQYDYPRHHIDKSKFSDVFMMLDDEETEDLVFLYL